MLTDEEIIGRIRAHAAAEQLPPPAPEAAADAFEALLGHPMPALLRRVYLEVADGGFGASGGVVSLTDNGEWFSDEESLPAVWRNVTTASVEDWPYPRNVLLLEGMGCAIWWCIDVTTEEGRMWGWDPNAYCERHRLFPERFTFAEWLTDWLDGGRTFPEGPAVDCADC